MASASEVAGDISAAASAVSGLILVYVGGLSASFSTFQPTERRTVLPSYQRRAWFAFVGLVLFLLAVSFAIYGKWFDMKCAVAVSMGLMLLGFGWVVATAVLTIMELR